MKTLLRFFVPCLLILSLHAQTQPKYAVLKTDNKDTFLDTVNQLADRGYRAFTYRVLASKDAAQLEQGLNAANQEGYTPLDFVWRVGWTAEGFLVLEKETMVSPGQ